MRPCCTAVVAQADDPLGRWVADELESRGSAVVRIAAARLGATPLTLTADRAEIDGKRLRGLLFTAPPGTFFGEEFDERDAGFCGSEAEAAWLAVTGLADVLCVNRLDADLWYGRAGWPLWRGRLEAYGIPVAPVSIGAPVAGEAAMWFPWGGGMSPPPGPEASTAFAAALMPGDGARRSVWLSGRCLTGEPSRRAEGAAAALAAEGVRLVEILDGSRGVLSVSAFPRLDDSDAATAARPVADALRSPCS